MKIMISMTSQDPLVLTKALGHIEPDKILTMSTPEADKWIENVQKVLGYYLDYKNFDDSAVELVGLESRNDNEQVKNIYSAILSFLKNIGVPVQAEIFCPVTLGNTFHKIALPEILSVVSRELNIPYKLVHIDADHASIIQGKGLQITSTHERLVSPYFIIGDIRKRFDIYGNLSFKKTPVLVWKEHEKSAFVNKVEAYKMLRDAFINNPKIRREMNSYVDDAKIDIKEKVLGQKIFLKKELENAISKASQKLGKALTIDPIEVGSAFQTGFYKVLELSSAEELDIDFWVEHINVDGIDKIFKEYNTNYREGFKKSIEKLAVETKLKKQERQSLYLKMTREIKKFIANVKDLLRNSFIKAAYAAGLGDKVNAVLSGSINTKNLNLLLERAQQSSSLNVSLFSSNCPDLFEEMLCCELYCYQNSCKNSADKIHAIYHGIEVDLGKENSDKKSNVMELDALVIKKTGNLLNFEAKTHFSSAPRKDMFSRIKNIKDYGGAKAKTYLVFPLTRDDIERIKDWVPGEEFNFCATPDGWKNYIKTTEIEENIKIIGFDEIGKELDGIK